jgi:deoxyhypusine synthase
MGFVGAGPSTASPIPAFPKKRLSAGCRSISTQLWKDANDKGERYFPHEYMYKMLLSGVLEQYYEIDPKDSWMLAAAERNLPIVCPGWEDSTMGNIFASYVHQRRTDLHHHEERH